LIIVAEANDLALCVNGKDDGAERTGRVSPGEDAPIIEKPMINPFIDVVSDDLTPVVYLLDRGV
jgi:hypothetical protein